MNTYDIKIKSGEVFGRKFRLLMGYHDMTLRDIAEKTNNAISTIGTWRNGKIPRSMVSIEQLANLFGVSVEYILSDDMKISDSADSNLITSLRNVNDQIDQHKNFIKYEDKNSKLHDEIIKYFDKFLDIATANDSQGALEYTLIRLKKEFPLNLFDCLK